MCCKLSTEDGRVIGSRKQQQQQQQQRQHQLLQHQGQTPEPPQQQTHHPQEKSGSHPSSYSRKRNRGEMSSECTRITDYLFVSGVGFLKVGNFERLGITCVINTAAELPVLDFSPYNIDYLYSGFTDADDEDLLAYMDECVDKIHQVRQSGGRTLVHCMGGVSRSVSICTGYLMKYCRLSLKKSLKKIRHLRPIANPNDGFHKQLQEYERFIFNSYRKRYLIAQRRKPEDTCSAQTIASKTDCSTAQK